jgi:hypothetical protein
MTMTTLLGLAIALTPFVAIIGCSAGRPCRPPPPPATRQIALTDAIHRELAPPRPPSGGGCGWSSEVP